MANVRGHGASSGGSGSGQSMWRKLTEPSRAVTDPEARRRARLLGAVLVVLVPASMVALLLGRLALTGQETEQTLLSAGGLVIVTALFVSWRLARTQHVIFAAWLALISLTAVPISGVVLRAMTMNTADAIDVATLTSALSWTLLPMLLSNMVLTTRSTAIFVGVLCLGIALLPALFSPVKFTDVVEPLGLIIAVSALVMVAGGIRREDRHRISAQNAELSRSEQRFRGLFDGTTVATCVHDDELNIIDVNTAFERLFGYAFDAACTLTVGDLVADDHEVELKTAVRERSEEAVELTGHRRDGSSFVLEARSNTHISRGEKIQLLELRDVSELREAQGQAAQARLAAEEAAHAQSEFLVHVGRTLRSPLSHAVAVVNTIGANRAGNLRDEDLTFLRRLKEHHSTLDNKIKDILLLSQLETGRVGITPSTAMLDRICGEVLDGARATIRRQLLTLSLTKPDLVAPVVIDVARLRQILKYILGHAISVSDNGFINMTITADPVTHVPTSIAIADASAGMSADDQAKIFQPLDVALKTDDERLGLTICRALTQLMGFELKVDSAIMQGTTITIELQGLEPAKLGVHSSFPGEMVAPPTHEEAIGSVLKVAVHGESALTEALSNALDMSAASEAHGGPTGIEVTQFPVGSPSDGMLTDADVVVCEVAKGHDERNAFGPLDTMLVEMSRPPLIATALHEGRLAVLGPLDTVAWPPTQESLDGVLQRYLQAGADERRVLVMTADESSAEASLIALQRRNCDVRVVISAERGGETLRSSPYDLFIIDAQFPLSDEAMSLLSEMRRDRRYLRVPMVFGVPPGGRLAAAHRVHLLAQSVERPLDKALPELRRLFRR